MLHAVRQSIKRLWPRHRAPEAAPAGSLLQPDAPLAPWVAADPLVQKYRALLGPLPWASFPERPTDRPWPGPQPDPRRPFVAAFLVKLHEDLRSFGKLRTYLREHPALCCWLGFAALPDRRQLGRVLRTLDPAMTDWLFSATVQLLRDTLPSAQRASFGDTIAGDTQAILAWVKENNPKQFIKEGRLDKDRQPTGDPDCKLGVKKRRNTAPEDADHPAPTSEAMPASQLHVGVDILWGYAAGIVVTAVPDGTEVVLAERTRPFNEDAISYFTPLMAQVERRLGRRPRFGTWDTAYDAHYVYDYFHQAGGFAAVPRNAGKRGGDRQFDAQGLPLCAAGLAMPLKFTYQDRVSNLVPYERGKYVCPLLHPQPTGASCPIDDPHWPKGGCTTTMATSAGARIRLQLDRQSVAYKTLYARRTMVERINSQAEALGLLRPKLRSQAAIANQNTLRYARINLRALQRVTTATPAGVTPSA